MPLLEGRHTAVALVCRGFGYWFIACLGCHPPLPSFWPVRPAIVNQLATGMKFFYPNGMNVVRCNDLCLAKQGIGEYWSSGSVALQPVLTCHQWL